MNYTDLTDERNKWRQQLETGSLDESNVLKLYRANRDSNLWRATHEIEKLCETILYLEGLNSMNYSSNFNCEFCSAHIINPHSSDTCTIRLNSSIYFCNLSHLKEWLFQSK